MLKNEKRKGKVKNEKYWSKLVIGAICMMAVATVLLELMLRHYLKKRILLSLRWQIYKKILCWNQIGGGSTR